MVLLASKRTILEYRNYFLLCFAIGPQLNSLQKVKEMLRRLRWQQERLHGRSTTEGQDAPAMFGPDFYQVQPTLPSLGPWAAEVARFVSCEQRGGRLDEIETLELARAMVVQQDRAEVRRQD